MKWFVPDRVNDPNILRAKKICDKCSVRESCLEDALMNDRGLDGEAPGLGVRGGSTWKERQTIKLFMAGRTYQQFRNEAIPS